MEKKEFKIGEEFQCGLIKLKVEKEKNGCVGCVFVCVGGACKIAGIIAGNCTSEEREDKTDVIFVEVEK
jgi:hypothetical protein